MSSNISEGVASSEQRMDDRMREAATATFEGQSGLNRSWVQALLAGDARGALQEIEQFLAVPPDFAWLVLAMPMDSDCREGFRALMSKYLQTPPSPKTYLYLIDQYINQGRYKELKKLSPGLWQQVHLPDAPASEITYSDEDTCLYDCFQRHQDHPNIHKPDAMAVPVIMAAVKRRKWEFVFKAGTDGFHRWFPVVLEEWRRGTELPLDLQALFYIYLIEDTFLYGRSSGTNARMEEILWEAFARGETSMMYMYFKGDLYCQQTLSESPFNQTHDSRGIADAVGRLGFRHNGMHIIFMNSLVCCKFSNREGFERVCQSQGRSVDERLDYLLNDCMAHWLTQDQNLAMFSIWADWNDFPALSAKLARIRQGLGQEVTTSEVQCMRWYLVAVMQLATADRSRQEDEVQVQRIAAKWPQIAIQTVSEIAPSYLYTFNPSPLSTATAHWSLPTVQALLHAGAGEELSRKEAGPLYYAIRRRDPRLVQILLEHKARPDLLMRPRSQYERASKINPLQLLIQLPVKPSDHASTQTRDDIKACAALFPSYMKDGMLQAAASVGNLEMVEFFLNSPSAEKMLECKNRSGNIPLFSSLSNNHAAMQEILLRRTPASSLRIPNNDGNTFFHLVMSGAYEIISETLKLMIPSDTVLQGELGRTPLMILTEDRRQLTAENALEIGSRLLDLGGAQQLMVPDAGGNTVFAKLCTASNPMPPMFASFGVPAAIPSSPPPNDLFGVSMLERILDMLPEVEHMAGVPLSRISKPSICLFLLRRQLITIEKLQEVGVRPGLVQEIELEMQRAQLKRPMHFEAISSPNKQPRT